MGKIREALRGLRREDIEYEQKQGNDDGGRDTHYSQKNGHKQRSEANNPRKKSKRR